MARAVLNASVFAIADGEKIQIGEQLDWRVTFERTGGNRSDWASRAAIPGGFEETIGRQWAVGSRH